MLIKQINEVREHVAVGKDFSFSVLRPHVRQAENRWIAPELGAEVCQFLQEKYDLETPDWSVQESVLFLLIQEAVANLAMYLYVPHGEVQVDDRAIQRAETDGFKTAYKNQVQALRDAYITAGLNALERALAYLEANADAFPVWKNSAERKRRNRLLIRSGLELQQHYSALHQPQRTYRSMVSTLGTVELFRLAPIPPAEIAALQYRREQGTLTATDQQLLDELCKAVAHFAIAQALAEQALRLSESGVTVAGGGADTTDAEGRRTAASERQTAMLAEQCTATGDKYQSHAMATLDTYATATVFPFWFAIKEARKASLQATSLEGINSQLSGSFSL